ncbi:pyridoxamine 5'-phosphate oxidase family protein [Sphingomonas sp. RB56-2]|uniref:Pyridoxamine 5'-phosphate oxidase family protein n=1 Tax=Sphingomonas brevis TaxID=2908206 RepID=A0ABT0SBF8_9SPHN|nr:pyridoxamine 5'-phosphate oxidase family protein [Sphingomonas brevis]MCL6741425.1 pyridoxamine 5'-phosphate oxidase family protein [Sphingomonas brevis]
MEIERLLDLARKLIDELTFCVAVTQAEAGDLNARVVQPLPMRDDWRVDVMTNRRCRKVREIESTGRMTLLYQHDADKSYVTLVGRAEIVEDLELKRAIWQPGHYRWNPGGPEDPATVFARLVPDRIELWSAVHDVMPEPNGYSAAVLVRDGSGWSYSET